MMAAAALVLAALPFGPGERITMRVTYAHVLAGHATMSVAAGTDNGRPVLRFVQDVKSEGVFAWLFRYRVDNHLVALWDPATGCSYGIEKKLRQGKYTRDQVLRIDPEAGRVELIYGGSTPVVLPIPPCTLDILSAFYVARARGITAADARLSVPVYDAGRVYDLVFRVIGKETLVLPAPLGRVATTIVEPIVPKGSGLFAQEGDLRVWVTDDARRIPVRARTKVAIGSVSADLESYVPGAVTASPFDAATLLPRSTSGTALRIRPILPGSPASGSRSSSAPARR